jgi:L-ascorbate metabolism protein UlaG (beta-lactamase superfamily)
VQEADELELSVSWLGHSTVLLEAAGVRLLTDPVLRPRVAHLRRVAPPVARLEKVDAVLISHVHYDHLDLPSLREVETRRVLAPRGSGRTVARAGLGSVDEVDVGDEVSIGPFAIRATHAEHRARRRPGSPETPSLGYLVSGPARVYFAGDTEPFEGMHALAPLDAALLPVWGWGPRLGRGHLSPEQAAETLRALEPRIAIPIHWGTYRRIGMSTDESVLREPAERFRRAAAQAAPEVAVEVLSPGEGLVVRAGTAAPAGGAE